MYENSIARQSIQQSRNRRYQDLNSILRLSLGRILFDIDIETEIKNPEFKKVFSTEMEKEALKVTH